MMVIIGIFFATLWAAFAYFMIQLQKEKFSGEYRQILDRLDMVSRCNSRDFPMNGTGHRILVDYLRGGYKADNRIFLEIQITEVFHTLPETVRSQLVSILSDAESVLHSYSLTLNPVAAITAFFSRFRKHTTPVGSISAFLRLQSTLQFLR